MTTVDMRGFTIIELMLFLGITGALFAALMLGVNGNLTQQQYRQGVQSYASLLQDEFSEVANTRNDRNDTWGCDAATAEANASAPKARGTSTCVIMGRAISVVNNGMSVETTPIIGTWSSAINDSTNRGDLDVITKDYKPKISDDFGKVEMSLGGGLTLKTIDNQLSVANYLIIRSPVSGLIRMFASKTPFPKDLSTVDLTASATQVVKNCVRGESGLLPTQSIVVDPRVAGPNGIILNEVDPECV